MAFECVAEAGCCSVCLPRSCMCARSLARACLSHTCDSLPRCPPVLPAIKSARGPNPRYLQSRGEPSLVQPSPAPVQVRVKGGMGQQLAAPAGDADYAGTMAADRDRSQLQSRGSTREAAMPKVPEENAAE